ncbi:hypothetical protein LCGC14_0318570 [marine sediment metagenome]|uniref:Uncharacterized protein n=1 Tax=marine sediment metagenome TaxID=412755 RepID=A0A0F9TQG0_9ZZZZ
MRKKGKDRDELKEIYPFEIWTAGALGRWIKCMVCDRNGPLAEFLEDPTVGEYRQFMCPTCGVLFPCTFGRTLWNFMCKVHYEDAGAYVMETRYF